MSVKERLISFVRYNEMSIRKFEIACGLSLGYINNIRVSIQPDKVTRIADQFPDLNTGWLLTGEGEMLKSSKPEEVIPSKEDELLGFLIEQSKSQQRTIEDQAHAILKMQETIENLHRSKKND